MNAVTNISYSVYWYKSNRKAMNRNWSNQKANPALKTKREIKGQENDKRLQKSNVDGEINGPIQYLHFTLLKCF